MLPRDSFPVSLWTENHIPFESYTVKWRQLSTGNPHREEVDMEIIKKEMWKNGR